jgi:hypothetical protein
VIFPQDLCRESSQLSYSVTMSGGSLSTVFAMLEAYSIKDLLAAGVPYALSPIPGPKIPDNTSWFTKIFGVRSVPGLGTLTSSMSGSIDTPIVHRSWGLLGYGPNFRFGEYKKVRNPLHGIAVHFGLSLVPLLLLLPFSSTIAKLFMTPPGEGPSKEQAKKDRVEFRGFGTPDIPTPNPPRAFCHAVYEGSVYGRRFSESL